MRIEYDADVDALYVRLRIGLTARTLEIDTGTLVDLDETGLALGVEVLRPARRWPLDETHTDELLARLRSQAMIADDDSGLLRALMERWLTPAAAGQLLSA